MHYDCTDEEKGSPDSRQRLFNRHNECLPEKHVLNEEYCVTTELRSPTQHDEDILDKAFVNEDGRTTLICPRCKMVKVVSVEQFRQRQHRLKARCSCSHVFNVNLDFRKCFRKPTNLSGIFNMSPPAVGGGIMRILNLSLEGACFEVNGVHKIKIGQKGRLDFNLDDRKETKMRREFVVRMVNGNAIGCQFLSAQAFEKELGFYLRFGP